MFKRFAIHMIAGCMVAIAMIIGVLSVVDIFAASVTIFEKPDEELVLAACLLGAGFMLAVGNVLFFMKEVNGSFGHQPPKRPPPFR